MNNTFKSILVGNVFAIAVAISVLSVSIALLMSRSIISSIPSENIWGTIGVFCGYFLLWIIIHGSGSVAQDTITGLFAWLLTTALLGCGCLTLYFSLDGIVEVFEGARQLPWHFWLIVSLVLILFNAFAVIVGSYAYDNFYEVTDKTFFRRSNAKIMEETWKYAVSRFCATYSGLVLLMNTIILSCSGFVETLLNINLEIS